MLHKIKQKCFSSQISYQFYDSVAKLPKIDWKQLTAEHNILFCTEYLKAIEDSLKEEIECNYILFFNTQKTLIGFAVTQLIKLNTKEIQNRELPCNLGENVKSTLLKNLDVNVLVCGNIFTCGEHHFVFNDNLISPKEAYISLAKALRDKRNLNNASEKPSFILIKEFWPQTFQYSDEIKNEDFSEIIIDANMVLKLDSEWKTFEDYLASMRTKFRTRAKKIIKDSNEIEIKNFSKNEIKLHEAKIDELYNSVIDNAYFKLGKLKAEVFIRLKEALKEKFIFTAYFLKGNLIGFKTCFVQKDNVEAFHVGFDYTYKKTHNIYQRMLYEYVDIAIKNKVTELRLGRTSETIKSAVGALPINMKLYVRHRNSISNTLLKPLVDFVSPNSAEIRNPFKKNNN